MVIFYIFHFLGNPSGNLGYYDAQGCIFLLFLLSYTSLRLHSWIFYSLEEKILIFFINFWAVVLKGTKSCRTQGDFHLFVCLSVIFSFVPPWILSHLNPALSDLKSALSGFKSVLFRPHISLLWPEIGPL